MKPGISHGFQVSSPRRTEKIQIKNVREVSMVDLWAAEAYLVVAIPDELKNAIEKIVRTTRKRMCQFLVIW